MILGTLQYPSRYCGLGDGVQKALRFLAGRDLAGMPTGRFSIDDDVVYVELIEATTVLPDAKLFEAHTRCIDLHLTLSGEEWYGYAPMNNLKAAGAYDSEKDILWYKGEGVYFRVPKGQFVLFFPEDGHKPCVTFSNPETIRKLVVKITTGRQE